MNRRTLTLINQLLLVLWGLRPETDRPPQVLLER